MSTTKRQAVTMQNEQTCPRVGAAPTDRRTAVAEFRVVVEETHTYELIIEAEDMESAMQAARKERGKGNGRRTSKTPWTAMPSVSRVQ